VAAVALAVAVLLPLRDGLGLPNILLLFLVPCVGVALTTGVGPAVLAAALGFLAVNFFFVPPYLSFNVDASAHAVSLAVYLGSALLIGALTARVRERTEAAERERQRAQQLSAMTAAFVGGSTLDDLLASVVERVATVFGADRCRILAPGAARGSLTVTAAFPADAPPPDAPAIEQAKLALGQRAPTNPRPGRGEPHRVSLPITTAARAGGVLQAERFGDDGFGPDDEALLAAFAGQAGLALERARLSEEAGRAASLAETDRLKTALLAAVSHDLRTPLASIKAAATSLLDDSVAWDGAARRDFLEAIDEETDRLSLMVGNLLDLSRIEGGALRPERAWYDAAELVADVAARFEPRMAGRPFSTRVEPDLPPLFLDYVEIAQVLANLLENALRYTPVGSPIALAVARVGKTVVLSLRDGGPGIPPEVQSRLFDTFYRVDGQRATGGSGLGLAICKGLVEAHGGRIWVESAPGAGAAFRFALPIDPPADGAAPGIEAAGERLQPAAAVPARPAIAGARADATPAAFDGGRG
jgi:two-component system sensor histidine kinase KdpD